MGLTVYGGGGKPEEEKTVTAGTSAIVVNPSSGKVMKKVTVNPTPTVNAAFRIALRSFLFISNSSCIMQIILVSEMYSLYRECCSIHLHDYLPFGNTHHYLYNECPCLSRKNRIFKGF